MCAQCVRFVGVCFTHFAWHRFTLDVTSFDVVFSLCCSELKTSNFTIKVVPAQRNLREYFNEVTTTTSFSDYNSINLLTCFVAIFVVHEWAMREIDHLQRSQEYFPHHRIKWVTERRKEKERKDKTAVTIQFEYDEGSTHWNCTCSRDISENSIAERGKPTMKHTWKLILHEWLASILLPSKLTCFLHTWRVFQFKSNEWIYIDKVVLYLYVCESMSMSLDANDNHHHKNGNRK